MQLKFEQRALEETLTDYAAEVDHHQRERVARLERAIDEAVDKVPASMRAVIDALQEPYYVPTSRDAARQLGPKPTRTPEERRAWLAGVDAYPEDGLGSPG